VRACIELDRDHGWGPTRVIAAQLKRDGYRVTEIFSTRHTLLALSGPRVRTGGLELLPTRSPSPPTVDGVTADPWQEPYSTLPVLPALAPLLPAGGLAKGAVIAVDRPGSLLLALVAGASGAGMWCGVAGIPELGIVAAAAMGVNPARMMLVPGPGTKWAEAASTMLDACEVVLLRPPGRVPAVLRRRLETAARKNGAALIVAGEWDGAPLRLSVGRQRWEASGTGTGACGPHLAEVVAEGRGTYTRPRRAWMWLPGPDGTVTAAAAPAGSSRHPGRASMEPGAKRIGAPRRMTL
jgi:hypothetical protein